MALGAELAVWASGFGPPTRAQSADRTERKAQGIADVPFWAVYCRLGRRSEKVGVSAGVAFQTQRGSSEGEGGGAANDHGWERGRPSAKLQTVDAMQIYKDVLRLITAGEYQRPQDS
ncbi:uncharacterized protein BDR25DRAFT_378708 [Lindgomyces ingoldianus]|uniref:Uncharacterized protein n=1 Tax=Lindgomyces ingoldianus TaxID=673940 RepID=A0ACB6QHB9_9PLEO|nr:uncharacterized protein BDR25DRAFT_378708 [Lindgomyces ingoldianus]KAF2465546.1 hypothetical protein BDR25DRAFT_378708 [Lindgomyces ingoldianus]